MPKVVGTITVKGEQMADFDFNDLHQLQTDYNTLKAEADGLRMALENAKEDAEKRVDELNTQLWIARSDLRTMKELVVRLSMKVVGMNE